MSVRVHNKRLNCLTFEPPIGIIRKFAPEIDAKSTQK